MPEENKMEGTPLFQSPTYRVDDFFETYANQAIYESSVWDLKIIFGQLDQSSGRPRTKQTVAITIPWAQAKLATFALKLYVAISELQNGKIQIREDLLPKEVPELTPEQAAQPFGKEIFEIYKRLREEFVRDL
jgi:hypothetical protein